MIKNVTVNTDQQLYVIETDVGFSCYGFENCEKTTVYMARELGRRNLMPANYKPALFGSIERYEQYRQLSEIVHREFIRSGFRSAANLTPELIGLEHKRVEVTDRNGEKRRFYVGKSTGWIPCHLEIKTRKSTGGESVYGSPFKSVKVIGDR